MLKRAIFTLLIFAICNMCFAQETEDSIVEVNNTRFKHRLWKDSIATPFWGKIGADKVAYSAYTLNHKNFVGLPPVSSILNTLGGRFPGLVSLQNSGEPGSDFASLSLRGQGLLYVIDGIPRPGISSFNIDEVESVTLLRDAVATAIYGLQAADGVLLVETKKSEGRKFKLDFTNQVGVQKRLFKPEFVDAETYTRLYNEALTNDGRPAIYTEDDFLKYKNGTNPITHPNIDWQKEILRNSAMQRNHTLSVSGMGANFRYFALLDNFNQGGMFVTVDSNSYNTNSDFERYTLRANVEFDYNKNITVGLNVFGRIQNTNDPAAAGGGSGTILTNLYNTPANAYPIRNPNGTWGGTQERQNNIVAQTVGSGYYNFYARNVHADAYLNIKLDALLKGLYAKVLLSNNNNVTQFVLRSKTFRIGRMNIGAAGDTTYNYFGTNDGAQVNTDGVSSQYRNVSLFGALGYKNVSANGNHNVDLGLNYHRSSGITLVDLPLVYSTINFAGNYLLKNKYIVNLTTTAGTVNRFSKTKWGFFPAAALGWIISNENFFTSNTINSLKLRTSYGLAGNYTGGYFNDKQYYSTGTGYNFGITSTPNSGYVEGILPNPNLSWVTARLFNIAVDATLLQKHLSVTAEYYNNTYSDLLEFDNTIPGTVGNSFNLLNSREEKWSGFELEVSYANQFRNGSYYVSLNGSAYNSKLSKTGSLQLPNDYNNALGKPVGIPFGFLFDGFYASEDDINKSPVIEGLGRPRPGDLKYKDLNKDGVINQFDQAPIRNLKPAYIVGLSGGITVGNFDLGLVFQGIGNRQIYLSGPLVWEFQNNGLGQLQTFHLDRWTAATAASATYPRLTIGTNPNNHRTSDYWVRNMSFIRLRSAEIGYTVPGSWMHVKKISGIRVFANGYNLLTISKEKRYDPESLSLYPVSRIINAGIRITLH